MKWGFLPRTVMVATALIAGVGAVAAGVTIHSDSAHPERQQRESLPLAGVVPHGWPYSEFRVLRAGRVARDRLPDGAIPADSGMTPEIIPESARRVLRDGQNEFFLAVNDDAKMCLLYVTVNGSGYDSICSDASNTKPGQQVIRGGFGDDYTFAVVSDGRAINGAVPRNSHSLTRNVWRIPKP